MPIERPRVGGDDERPRDVTAATRWCGLIFRLTCPITAAACDGACALERLEEEEE